MDPILIFALIVAVFFLLIFLCVPIFAALGVASILGFVLYGGVASLETIPDILHRGLSSYSLLAVPLFILMGEVMARTSIGAKLFNMFALWSDRLPGGLGVASVASSAVFGAMSGVSVAGAATIGRFAIPEMLSRGYRRRWRGARWPLPEHWRCSSRQASALCFMARWPGSRLANCFWRRCCRRCC